jgi:hypothetical protein
MTMLIIKKKIDGELNIFVTSTSLSEIILETGHSSKREGHQITRSTKNPAARSSLPGQIIGGRVHNDPL